MCGIVGAVAERDVTPILLEGLRRLEYRGYDSAGVAVASDDGRVERRRTVGKVGQLADLLDAQPLRGHSGIAHTRWATHGVPSNENAHPHMAGDDFAIVHNGIIENYLELRREQRERGVSHQSDTDTETVVHQVKYYYDQHPDLLEAVRRTIDDLDGAYALGVVTTREPGRLVAARSGSPLVVGVGIGEYFVASDVFALLPVTQRFIFLEEGDIVDLRRDRLTIYDAAGQQVERPIKESQLAADAADKGEFRHFMLKEIHEQPRAIAETLEGRLADDSVLEAILGPKAAELLDQIKRVQIVACGTSYHAGMVARYWFEGLAGVPCDVEVASEYRYRRHVVAPGTLFVTISQSGETADSLAALRQAGDMGFAASLTVCNVPESSLVRESDLALMTRAGPEIGVASTKAFTTQLTALLLLVVVLGRRHAMSEEQEKAIVAGLRHLPAQIESVLTLEATIEQLAESFVDKHHALFLGRGVHYPIAMEGALKLKEISYIHAEAYPAGELKHGPLALVDEDMPVVAVAPKDELLEKLKSNLEEVRARGGKLFLFADPATALESSDDVTVLHLPSVDEVIAPILYTVPLQLLSYHVAVLKGTDVDQPRNLAKSVTVE